MFKQSTEYEALIIGLKILNELGAQNIKVIDDSKVVIKQAIEEYQCESPNLRSYLSKMMNLFSRFKDVKLVLLSRAENEKVNELAQAASGTKSR